MLTREQAIALAKAAITPRQRANMQSGEPSFVSGPSPVDGSWGVKFDGLESSRPAGWDVDVDYWFNIGADGAVSLAPRM